MPYHSCELLHFTYSLDDTIRPLRPLNLDAKSGMGSVLAAALPETSNIINRRQATHPNNPLLSAMDHKPQFAEESVLLLPHTRSTVRRRWKEIILSTLATGLLLNWLLHQTPLPGRHHCHSKPDSPNQYAGEHITWTPCGDVSGKTVECSEINVPMDQFNETNSGNKTFSIPLIRLRGENATQNLLLNPGGPGGSGIEFIYRRGKQLSDIVGEGFHLLSFDPRGINGSKPLASCYPTTEARRELSGVRDVEPIHDSPEVRSALIFALHTSNS